MYELSKTLVIVGMLAPLGAGAIGIGDIRSNSALNQLLNAEIPLVLSGADKLDNIRVRLASPEAFDKAGVDRLHALTQLRFKPVAKPDGRFIIEVSSREIIQEPFLDFLVEVESPQGTLLREFTLLLDPPRGVMQAGGGMGRAPDATVSRYQPAANEAPGSWAPSPPGYLSPAASDESGYSYTPSTRRGSDVAITQDQLTGETYGPVRRGETLFDIVRRIGRPASTTPGQMATALYLANPKAFSRNIHGLRAGSRLRIPTENFIASLGAGDTGGAAAMAPEIPSPNRQGLAYGRPPVAPSQNLGAPRAGTMESAGAVAEVSARVPSALKNENEELRERLSQLEQRLEEAQRLIALKNAELAALQDHHSSPPAESESAAPPASGAESAIAPVPAETGVSPAPAAAQSAPPAFAPAPTPRPASAAKPETLSLEEPPFITPAYWFASGILAMLGLGWVWLYSRRRTKADDDGAGRSDKDKYDRAREPIVADTAPVAAKASANRLLCWGTLMRGYPSSIPCGKRMFIFVTGVTRKPSR